MTGQIVTAVMAGYLIGLVLLVPLADRFSPGRLVPIQLAGLAIVLAAAASAPTAGALVGVFGLVGVASTVAAEAVSAVKRFMPLEVRGSRVGIVLAERLDSSQLFRRRSLDELAWLAWHARLPRNSARSDRRAVRNRIASASETNRKQRFVLYHSASASSIAVHLSSISTGIRNRHALIFCFQSHLSRPFNSALQTAL